MRIVESFKLAAAFWLLLCLAALPTSAQTGEQGNLYDYPDTLLSGIVSAQLAMSTEQCRSVCAARSGCAGFDHSSKGDVCRLFASIGSARNDTGAIAGTRSLLQSYRDPTNPPLAMRLEKLRTTDTTGDQLLALSKEAYAQGDRGVGWQAINLALQRGNTEAKIELARWYDPRTFAADRVDAVDANKAARSYFELALEGNPDANALLASLCREASNSGSSYANAFESFLGTTYCEGSITP